MKKPFIKLTDPSDFISLAAALLLAVAAAFAFRTGENALPVFASGTEEGFSGLFGLISSFLSA